MRILATDLDGTFIGDDDAMTALWRDLDDVAINVVFCTGRHLESIDEFYRQTGSKRRAAACITMVGTEIWIREYEDYCIEPGWTAEIARGWDLAAVEAALARVPELTRQPEEWQSPYKLSFFVPPTGRVVGAVEDELERDELSAHVVHSGSRFLDILPGNAGKGAALRYLASRWETASEEVIAAGDSGNDIDMMRPELGFRAIVVGNATAELKALHTHNVYHSQAHAAAGIREGLEHYGWL